MVCIIFYLLYRRFQKHQSQVPSLFWAQFLSKYEVELDWVLCHWELMVLPTIKQKEYRLQLSIQQSALLSLSLTLAGSLSHTQKNTQVYFFLKNIFIIWITHHSFKLYPFSSHTLSLGEYNWRTCIYWVAY